MDRIVWAAWRAVWVALGASTVIVAQALVAPAAPPASAADIAPPAAAQPSNDELPTKTISAKARTSARAPHAS